MISLCTATILPLEDREWPARIVVDCVGSVPDRAVLQRELEFWRGSLADLGENGHPFQLVARVNEETSQNAVIPRRIFIAWFLLEHHVREYADSDREKTDAGIDPAMNITGHFEVPRSSRAIIAHSVGHLAGRALTL
jgi:hypothetical protein